MFYGTRDDDGAKNDTQCNLNLEHIPTKISRLLDLAQLAQLLIEAGHLGL